MHGGAVGGQLGRVKEQRGAALVEILKGFARPAFVWRRREIFKDIYFFSHIQQHHNDIKHNLTTW